MICVEVDNSILIATIALEAAIAYSRYQGSIVWCHRVDGLVKVESGWQIVA